MTLFEKLIIDTTVAEIGGLSGSEAAKRLVAANLISAEQCRRLAIRRHVARAAGEGLGKVAAIHEAAGIYCCSYQKARAAVYDKKQKTL